MSNTEMIVFRANAIAEFGNRLLTAIVQHETIKEEAEAALANAAKQENFFDVEIAKALVHLQGEEAIDLYKVYGDDKQSSASLYRQILVSLGVLKRTITDNDTVEYAFTDPALEKQYYFPSSMNDPKKENESEEAYKARIADYTSRRAKRNALNTRLQRCCKAAIALIEAGATVEDLQYRENDAGMVEVVLKKGPTEVVGTKGEVVIVTGNAAKAEGASLTPTMSGLAKVADNKHKVAPAAAKTGESATRKETDGKASSNSEEDFLALVNTLLMAVKSREGVFTDTEKTALASLGNEIKGFKAK